MALNGTAAYSYAIAALAALGFWVLLLRWRRRSSLFLGGAALATALWGGVNAADQALVLPDAAVQLADWLRNAAWSAVLLSMLGQFRAERPKEVPLLRWSGAIYLAALLLPLLQAWLAQSAYFNVVALSGLALALLGLALVEQLYRNTHPQKRWAVKFACLGIGGLFAYDFYVYSDALLFHELSQELWAGRGLVTALAMPLLALSVLRHATAVPQLALSRRMLFHSAAMAGAAAYLLTMSLTAYYLRYVGGSWGSLMQLAFLFGATLLLAGIVSSGTTRAWLKVFISKHFFRYNYDYREEWLRFTNTLSQPGPLLAERSIQALAALVDSPGGALWMRRASGSYEPSAQWQMTPQQAVEQADAPFCQFMEQRQWLVDLTAEPAPDSLASRVPLPSWMTQIPRAALVVPLMLHGQLIGFVLLLRAPSPVALNWEVIDLLKIAGSQAASYLAQHAADNALMLARQFDSFNRLSTFVVHDLKNLVAQLSLLTSNAEKHRDNPEFQADMQRTMAYSVQKMRGMLQKLSRSASTEQAAPLSLEKLLRQVIDQKAVFSPKPALRIVDHGLDVLADAERLERVLGHLIQNAIEATPRDGGIAVTLYGDAAEARLEICDTGSGMSEEFVRERLFKPFDSTKSAGMGIGAFESREYIHELGGRLQVRSAPGSGTTFSVHLPRHQQRAVGRAG